MPNVNVLVPDLDLTAIDAPQEITYHGMSIRAGYNYVEIGRITDWGPQHSKEAIHTYELKRGQTGRPVSVTPGKITGNTISFTRVEIWQNELEIALGFGKSFIDLCDQNKPFRIYEEWYKGKDPYKVRVYCGCWFTEKNPNSYSAEGDMRVVMTGNIIYTICFDVFY